MKKDKYYFSEHDLRRYIKKSHLKAVEKFNKELQVFSEETGESPVTLYEDAYTDFTLTNIAISSEGEMIYDYCGHKESEVVVRKDEETGEYYEEDGMDSIMEYIKFWRACLRRAKRYWSMDSDKLDKIQDGEIEDEEEED